jgi:integrase
MSLAQARVKAASYSGKEVHNNTLGTLLDEWHADVIVKKYRRPKEVRGHLDRLDAGLKATKLRDLTRLGVRTVLKRHVTTNGPIAANRMLSILKTALKYARDSGYIEVNPIEGLSAELIGGSEEPCSRTLTDEEIRKLWHADSQHVPLLRFLLLTGQRIGEAQLATWSSVHSDKWHIPAEHAKNDRAHWVALSRQTLRHLGSLDNGRELIFGRATTTGVQSWLRRWCERENIAPPAFTPHDLRRTLATRMNEIGVQPFVVEKILNHKLQGMQAVYDLSEREGERIEAMQKWADELERIVANAQ